MTQTKAKQAPVVSPYCFYKGKPVYNKAAACILLECCEKTLDNYIALGLIKKRNIGSGRFTVSFFEEDLDKFLGQ